MWTITIKIQPLEEYTPNVQSSGVRFPFILTYLHVRSGMWTDEWWKDRIAQHEPTAKDDDSDHQTHPYQYAIVGNE